MSDEVDKHVLRKYDISQKMGKGVSSLGGARGSPSRSAARPVTARPV